MINYKFQIYFCTHTKVSTYIYESPLCTFSASVKGTEYHYLKNNKYMKKSKTKTNKMLKIQSENVRMNVRI